MIKKIWDNGGESADRYAIYFDDDSLLCCSHDPGAPQGVSHWMYVEAHDLRLNEYDKEITFDQLPERVQEYIRKNS